MDMSVVGPKDTPTGGKPLVLPILKYSYATSSADRNSPLGWTHLSGGADLVAIFDHGTIVDQRSGEARDSRFFKVQRGLEILEELNLGSLAQEAARGSSAYSPRPPQDSKSSIAVLVKSPCLAIRYPARINQVRRCQVKFSSEADYSKAVSILREVGCPITESSTTGPGYPPGPATSYPARPASSAAAASSAPCPMSRATASPVPAARFAPSSFPEVAPPSGVREPRPSSIGSSSSTLRATPSVSSNHQVHTSASTTTWRAPGTDNSGANNNNNDRPSTAPPFPDPASLNQILPPKRELPFAKPASTTKRAGNRPLLSTTSSSSSQQVSSTAGAIPPSSAGPAADAKLAAAAASPSAQSIQKPQGAAAYFNQTHNITEPPTQNPSTLPHLQTTTLPAQPDHHHHAANATSTDRSPFATSSPSFINQVSTGVPHADNTTTTAANTATAATTTTTSAAQQPPTSTTPVPPPEPTPPDLSTYLATPTPERAAQLESWMCVQLESEGFLALCQDVEGLWRRVVYGL